MPVTIQNAVKITEDGLITYLPSTHVHHLNTYTFKDGKQYFVDGGIEYYRRGGNMGAGSKSIENYNLDSECLFDEICEKLLWGTRGLGGKSPVKYLPFADLELSHLKAILDYDEKLTVHLSKLQIEVINHWIYKKS